MGKLKIEHPLHFSTLYRTSDPRLDVGPMSSLSQCIQHFLRTKSMLGSMLYRSSVKELRWSKYSRTHPCKIIMTDLF